MSEGEEGRRRADDQIKGPAGVPVSVCVGMVLTLHSQPATPTETLAETRPSQLLRHSDVASSFRCLIVSLPRVPSLDPRLLLDPASQLGDARVNARLVAAGAALAPAHDAGLEPLPTFLEARQGSARVALMTMKHFQFCFSGDARGCQAEGEETMTPDRPTASAHLAGVHSSEQEATAQHPGRELALRHLVAHCVVDDLHRRLLQYL